jgi:hypothetical protein
MNGHDVHFVERFGTVRTFPHTVGDPVFYTVVAEQMATSLENRVLEVFAADRAKGEGLDRI